MKRSTSSGRQRACHRILKLLTITAFALANLATAGAQTSPSRLRILVFNYSAASRPAMAGAEREAGRILSQAGLDAEWLVCPVPLTPDSHEACAAEVGGGDVRVRIVNHPEPNYFGDSVFGFTVAPALASVYYESALRMAKIDNSDYEMPVILGCVIAHEIGHVLLGPNAHSPSGIMQREWKREQVDLAMRGRLLFTPAQARIVRAQAELRLRQQASGVASLNP